MSIIDHTVNKYDMLFHTHFDLLPLIYPGNDNFVLQKSRKCPEKLIAVGTMVLTYEP